MKISFKTLVVGVALGAAAMLLPSMGSATPSFAVWLRKRRGKAMYSKSAVLCWSALALLPPSLVSAPALAVPTTKTAGVAVASTGTGLLFAASIVGAPVAGFIGGFEIGWGLGCALFDPADIANAGIPVSIITFSGLQLPDVQTIYPGTPVALANALNSQADLMDSYVANVRATRASLDRYEGALLIGRPDFASDRLSEANAFQTQALDLGQQAVNDLPSVFSVIDSIDPNLLALHVTLADALAVRDEIGLGIFPPFEQFALTAWAVTPAEMNALELRIGGTPDSAFNDLFLQLDPVNGNSTTVGDALTAGTEVCATCLAVPEPSSWLVLLAGLAGLVVFPWRKRNRAPRRAAFVRHRPYCTYATVLSG